MGGFSEALKKKFNLSDADEKRIMALFDALGGVGLNRPVDFIDAPDKLHKLGWHHDDEVAK